MKGRMLRLLSVDARISMQELANSLKTTKVNAYNLFNEVSGEYLMHFVPEISIDKLWKWEFIKRARLRTKRGILAEAVEELPVTGFGEYIIFVKFRGREPKDEEIVKAIGDSYVPQFAARLRGEYSLLIYCVARSYEDATQFADAFGKHLDRYDMLTYTNRAWSVFGFFPLKKKLIEQFDIFDTYKNLLFGLCDAGRSTFTEIGKRFNQGPAQMLYAYDRLARTEILKRVTYYESRPKNGYNLVALIKIVNVKAFEASRSGWFARLARDYESRENECTFICDMPDPKSMLVIANAQSRQKAAKFVSGIRHEIKGVEIATMLMPRVLVGNLGVRDFDMRHSAQYKILERSKLVPSLREKPIEQLVEDPNALG